MKFGSVDFDLTQKRPPIILAEVGVNHNRSLEIAKKLVDVAVECGADAVKFQRFISEEEISLYADKADYQKDTTGEGSQLEMCKALEFPDEYLIEMRDYCAQKNIGFLVTAFEPNSVDWLVDVLGMTTLKIPSSETTNIPMLEQIGRKGVDAILSTGASYIEEVKEAIAALKRGYAQVGAKDAQIMVLHCVSQYPAPDQDLNLMAMKTLEKETGCMVGWSDHSIGVASDIIATALGAVLIEKHYTLDKSMEGPDHRASMEPEELAELVRETRRAFVILGHGEKKPVASEDGTRPLIKKSVVAFGNMPAGTVITMDNVKFKRPCPENAITPADVTKILGKKVARDIKDDQPITWDDIQAHG